MLCAKITIGDNDNIGRRPTMEDIHLSFKKVKNGRRVFCAGVFDGHGGKDVVKYLKPLFCKRLYDALDLNNVPQSLSGLFASLDSEIKDMNLEAGSTAAVAVFVDNVLHCANVGDTEACLVKKVDNKLETINLVYKHTGADNDEITRIESLGGWMCWGRVMGELAVTRAFGDLKYKSPRAKNDFVSVDPFISTTNLDSTCKYVIIACDGLWDVCTHDEAASLVDKWFSEGKPLKEIAEHLVKHALTEGSSDNVTVQVIQLDWDCSETEPLDEIDFPEITDEYVKLSTALVFKRQSDDMGSSSDLGVNNLVMDFLVKEMIPIIGPTLKETISITAPPKPLPESYIFLKTLENTNPIKSMFYLSADQGYFCINKLGVKFDLPGWLDQRFISGKLFGQNGLKHLDDVERYYNGPVFWATEFSNVNSTFVFDQPKVIVGGESYNGPEHYFQLMKSFGTPDHDKAKCMMKNANPDQCYSIGRRFQMREDWEQEVNMKLLLAQRSDPNILYVNDQDNEIMLTKDFVMYEALEAKFTQCASLKDILLETVGKTLAQLKPNDTYWGTGPDGKGLNKQGKILMIVRDSFL